MLRFLAYITPYIRKAYSMVIDNLLSNAIIYFFDLFTPIPVMLACYFFKGSAVRVKDMIISLVEHSKKIKDLKEEVGKLKLEMQNVEELVEDAERNGEDIDSKVEDWLMNAEEKIETLTRFLEDKGQKSETYLFKLCPILWIHWKLGRQVREMELLLASCKAPPLMEVRYINGGGGGDFFKSRMNILKAILKSLRDPTIEKIGVHGMGGVGKTTLALDVMRIVEEEKMFDEVVMAIVSQSPDVKEIQQQIANKLKLKFDEPTLAGRKEALLQAIGKQRIIIILDDIWAQFDLASIGVLSEDESDGYRCKILMTSRSFDVLSREMRIKALFQVQMLEENEAWNLFRRVAGEYVKMPDVEPIAIEICKRCSGLPIAIVTAAKFLKNRNLHVWRTSLRELQSPNIRSITGKDEVHSILELSYRHLKEEVRSIFLLCAQVGPIVPIHDLVKYVIGLRLLQGVTVEEARDRTHTALHYLKDCSLLLDRQSVEYVQMHDVVHDFGIAKGKEELNAFTVTSDISVGEWPDPISQRKLTAISLRSGKIQELPERLECPDLKLFVMDCTSYAREIEDRFFVGMQELKVLDLTSLQASKLPSSIQFLSNLKTLCLDKCMVRDINIIGNLKKLEVLSCLSSDIRMLPKEIGNLTQLRFLDLNGCCYLEKIAPNVISSLLMLEELYMRHTPYRWTAARLAELKDLPSLSTLEIDLPNAEVPKNFIFDNVMRYKITVGNSSWKSKYASNSEISRMLELKLDRSSHFNSGIQELLKRAQGLCLYQVRAFNDLLYILKERGFPHLKFLQIQNCVEVEFIAPPMLPDAHIVFPALESLYLLKLPSLEKISYGQLPQKSFGNLTLIQVIHCQKIKFIFLAGIARHLPQLQEVQVEKCSILSKIIAEDDKDQTREGSSIENVIELSHLRSLTLKYLPMLKSFYLDTQKENLIGQNSTDEVLLNRKVCLPSLESLNIIRIDGLDAIWNGQLPKTSLYNVRSLVVEDCPLLRNIIPFDMLDCLKNIKVLKVKSCELLEEVVDFGGRAIGMKFKPLPRLLELYLVDLPGLRHICKTHTEGHIGFHNLQTLEIQKCDNLRSVFTLSMALSLVNLRHIEIKRCIVLKDIVTREGSEEQCDNPVFPLVRTIILEKLPDLISFCPRSHALKFPSLKATRIAGCPRMGSLFPEKRKWDDMHGRVNCTLYARSLCIAWGDDRRCWAWKCFKESREGHNIEVAKLISVDRLDVCGKIPVSDLSAGVTYEVVCNVKLAKDLSGWVSPVTLKLTHPDGNVQEQKHSLSALPQKQWIELQAGCFTTNDQEDMEVEFHMTEEGEHWKSGLTIRGITIRPKENDETATWFDSLTVMELEDDDEDEDEDDEVISKSSFQSLTEDDDDEVITESRFHTPTDEEDDDETDGNDYNKNYDHDNDFNHIACGVVADDNDKADGEESRRKRRRIQTHEE